ncbi:hypothetical protein [Gloeocapsa sp. PCC 73106]|uniref:hypothetical protein n=1 Tax=Gloeocapsa sp. PCC 73106 TaxID=102232 RepID=UPI0002ACF2F7|nr:hypothetical protein [Gloeocapsa sp. PCC 73106]ELR96308.1 hypothetical protein GLO73106DRAFT_00000970 [Gloeocapsa sp. PCC 73106]
MNNSDYSANQAPPPCIVESGIVVYKQDMQRLLTDIRRVRYLHLLDERVLNQGEGWIKEVFIDPHRSTLVANHHLYLNLQSFDYLKLEPTPEGDTYFELIHENRQLRLIPLTSNIYQPNSGSLDVATLEAMLTQVLSAKWDVQLDDDEYSF